MAIQESLGFATQTLDIVLTPADTETVVTGPKTYTFQTTLTDSDGNVLIGADAEASLDNLRAAVTLGAGSGTTYAASTTRNPVIGRVDETTTTQDTYYAIVPGTIGNEIAVSETLAGAGNVWGAAALAGGTGNLAIGLNEFEAANPQLNSEVLQDYKKLTAPAD